MYTQSDDIRHNLVQAAGLRDHAHARHPLTYTPENKPNTNPIPINQSARSRRRRLSAKSCRDRVKNTSIKNSLKWAYVRGALRPALALISATSRTNLNLTPPLYTSSGARRPPRLPAAARTHTLVSLTRTGPPIPVSLALKSRHTENSVRAAPACGEGGAVSWPNLCE